MAIITGDSQDGAKKKRREREERKFQFKCENEQKDEEMRKSDKRKQLAFPARLFAHLNFAFSHIDRDEYKKEVKRIRNFSTLFVKFSYKI